MIKKSENHRTTTLKKYFPFLFSVILFPLIGSVISCVPGHQDEAQNGYSLMGRGYGINAATLVVKDLDSTLNYFVEVLGFERPREEKPVQGIFKGTRSYMLPFPDMSSIALLMIEDSVSVKGKDSLMRSYLRQNEDTGVQTYSLSSSSVDSTHSWLTSQGFKMDSVTSFLISNPGQKASSWDSENTEILRLGFESMNPSAHLPVFLEFADFPYERMHEWKSFYNMQRGFMNHPNGVVGTTAVKIVVEDLEVARDEFRKMGFAELEENQVENFVRFKLKRDQELLITAPLSPDDELSRFLKERGTGVFALVFEVKDLGATYDFLKEKLPANALLYDSLANHLSVLKEYAKGVQLEFKKEPEAKALIAEQTKLSFGSKMDSTAAENAAGLYLKYCALCHGENREGGAADFAPSLRSHSLMATTKSSNFLRYTIQYGRANTAMAGYYKERGGPLEFIEIELLLKWLYESSGVEEPVKLSRDPVKGDTELGAKIYAEKCTECHGINGEGVSAPALGNPMLLATASDHFLRYAIAEGRDGTEMASFKDSLNQDEINAVTAFLRSRASGWNVPAKDTVSIPLPEDYVLNPEGEAPDFELREGLYLSAVELNRAMMDKKRLVILDARSEVAWRQTHIPGAVPVPYYEEPESFMKDFPNDSTWIIAYCACPHAASGQVIKKLKKNGYKNTAILDEGILVWAQEGYPVQHGN